MIEGWGRCLSPIASKNASPGVMIFDNLLQPRPEELGLARPLAPPVHDGAALSHLKAEGR